MSRHQIVNEKAAKCLQVSTEFRRLKAIVPHRQAPGLFEEHHRTRLPSSPHCRQARVRRSLRRAGQARVREWRAVRPAAETFGGYLRRAKPAG